MFRQGLWQLLGKACQIASNDDLTFDLQEDPLHVFIEEHPLWIKTLTDLAESLKLGVGFLEVCTSQLVGLSLTRMRYFSISSLKSDHC